MNNSSLLKKGLLGLVLLFMALAPAQAQVFPSPESNIPYLLTFGRGASASWGDDDYSMTFFFLIPETYDGPVYLRVYDPQVGGAIDEERNGYNTKTTFAIYGKNGAFSDPDAQSGDPTGNYRSGELLDAMEFGNDAEYDEKWYTFREMSMDEGEEISAFGGKVFKIISEGMSGDDGNLFKYALSSSPTENKAIEGAQGFTFEYTFRLPDGPVRCHLYPFITDNVVSITQSNFDWDDDGAIRIVSIAKRGELVVTSEDGDWAESIHEIVKDEHGNSLDIQLIKQKEFKNNNVVFRVRNQYDQNLPFYSTPIGVITPKGGIGVRQ